MRILFGMAAAAWLLATGAFAADLPIPYTRAPMFVEPVFNWTGFYVGGNIGYSWGRSSDTSTLTNTAGTALLTSTGTTDLNGVVGGGQIGYNWQIQNWVWGLEADIQGTNEKGTRNFICPAGVCIPTPPAILAPVAGIAVPVALNQKIDWFGTVRGRAGVLATPTLLLYATGGSGLRRGRLQCDDRSGVDCICEHRRNQFRLDGRRRHRGRDRRQLDRSA